MSKTKHTPEPWDAYESTLDGVSWLSISKAGLSIDDEVPVVCMVTKIESLNKTDVENARRIVLCVNACKNLSNGELDDLIHLDGLSLNMLEKTRQQRDTAWQELREIQEAIKADENESTADEVRSLVAKYDAAHRTLEDHGPEGHCVTNQQHVDLRFKWFEMKDRLSALEEISTAVEADIDAGRPLEYNVDELRTELIRARKALGILPEQEQTTTLGMEGLSV